MNKDHHPSYAADRKWFCLQLALQRTTYARIAVALQEAGWKRPSEGDQVYRRHIIQALQAMDFLTEVWHIERRALDLAAEMGVQLG